MIHLSDRFNHQGAKRHWDVWALLAHGPPSFLEVYLTLLFHYRRRIDGLSKPDRHFTTNAALLSNVLLQTFSYLILQFCYQGYNWRDWTAILYFQSCDIYWKSETVYYFWVPFLWIYWCINSYSFELLL